MGPRSGSGKTSKGVGEDGCDSPRVALPVPAPHRGYRIKSGKTRWGWPGYFLRNHSCRLRPTPQGMKMGYGGVRHCPITRAPLQRAPTSQRPYDGHGIGRYFRTNSPWRLPPLRPLMKMGPRSESGKTRWGWTGLFSYQFSMAAATATTANENRVPPLGSCSCRRYPPPRPTVGTGSSPARRGGGGPGYFRTNSPWRLPPPPPLMKTGSHR